MPDRPPAMAMRCLGGVGFGEELGGHGEQRAGVGAVSGEADEAEPPTGVVELGGNALRRRAVDQRSHVDELAARSAMELGVHRVGHGLGQERQGTQVVE